MNPWESSEVKTQKWSIHSLEVILRRMLQVLALVVIYTWIQALSSADEIYHRIHDARELTMFDCSLAPFYLLSAFARPVVLTAVYLLMVLMFRLQYDPHSPQRNVSMARESVQNLGNQVQRI